MSDQFEDHDRPSAPPTRRSAAPRVIALLLVVLVCGLFVTQNRQRVRVDFIIFDRFARMWVVIVLSMALGALLAEVVRLAVRRRRRRVD